jgi:hypothetical protein
MIRAIVLTGALTALTLASCQDGKLHIDTPEVRPDFNTNGVIYTGPEVSENRNALLNHRYFAKFFNAERSFDVEGYLHSIQDGKGVWLVRLQNLPEGTYEFETRFCSGFEVAINGCEGTKIGETETVT